MSEKQTVARSGPTVAIIGSGPSGCYTAQFLRKALPNAEITIFEALPVPYGLVRYGVAADHQGTKAVTKQFDRLFERGAVTFVGNTRIGADIPFDNLTDAFDIVVVATGLPDDRRLPVHQDEGASVVGAGRILRALNALPEQAAPLRSRLGEDLVVVGHGNVALDVARLLCKSSPHLAGSDIHDAALEALRPTPPRTVHLLGRSPAESAKFDLAMLRELCNLDTVRVRVQGMDDSEDGPVSELLRQAAQRQEPEAGERTAVTFHFRTVPTAVRDRGDRTVVETIDAAGASGAIETDSVITAIGFCQTEATGADVPAASWSGANVYRVGWLDRGGRGNIAENRKHAQSVAQVIVSDLGASRLPYIRKPGLSAVLPLLHSATVDYPGWLAIDEAERRAADAQRCRRKIADLDEMLAIAHSARA